MFDIAVIDPPWNKQKGGLRNARPNQGKNLDYSTMDTVDIFKLLDDQIFTQLNTPHIVFLWCIDSFLPNAENEMFSRNYRQHARMIWDKQNGVAPAFSIRYTHEYCLWYYKPKFIPVSLSTRGKFKTVFVEKAREHSRKPDIFYNMVSEMFPGLKKLDVFSREKRDGWEQWGNEISHFSEGSV